MEAGILLSVGPGAAASGRYSAPGSSAVLAPQAVFAPHVSVLRGTLRDRGGRVSVRVHCRTGAACKGSVKIRERETVLKHHGKHTIRQHKLVVIGTAHLQIAAGKTRSVKVRLNARGRHAMTAARHAALAGHGKHTRPRIRVKISAHTTGGNTANRNTSIELAATKKHHKR